MEKRRRVGEKGGRGEEGSRWGGELERRGGGG